MAPARRSAAGPSRSSSLERVELRGVLLEVRGDEGLEDLLDRHLATGWMDATQRPRLRREGSGGIGHSGQLLTDAGEESLGVGVAVALDRLYAARVGLHASE